MTAHPAADRQPPGVSGVRAETPMFAAPMGTIVRVVTGLTCVLFGSMAAYYLAHARPLGGVMVGLLVVPALFSVRGYSVTATELLIHRPGWRTRRPLADLANVIADPHATARSWRVAGNGGMFAFLGWFRNARLGSYRAFYTDATRAVVLTWPGATVVVSPDDPDAFVAAVRRSVPAAATTPLEARP